MLYGLSPSMLMQVVVPAAIVTLITAGVAFLVTQGIKEVLAVFKVDLSPYAAAATALVVTLVVAFLNGLLAQIPANFSPLAEELLRLLVLLIGAIFPTFGLFRVYKNLKTGGTPFR